MLTEDQINEVLKKVLLDLTDEDFAFEFELDGVHWSGYHWGPPDHRGTIVITMPEAGNAHVGLFRTTRLSADECRALFLAHKKH